MLDKDLKIVNDKTLIPAGLAVSLIGGLAFWFATLYQQTLANAAQIARLSDTQDRLALKQEKYTDDIIFIKGSLAVIGEQTKQLLKKQK